MATFIGFSTVNINQVRSNGVVKGINNSGGSTAYPISKTTKKFRLTDRDLIIQDLINALNIPMGQKPGKPEYGTGIWDYIFEPNTLEIQTAIQDEVRREISLDPRLEAGTINVYTQDYSILVEVELNLIPLNDSTCNKSNIKPRGLDVFNSAFSFYLPFNY